jgi:hypothetical protein
MTATVHTLPIDQLLAVGSTLPVDCRPTVGVVPGAEWTGLAVRIGTKVVDTSVVGRQVACGDACKPDNPAAEEWLWVAILGRLEDAMRRHDTAARRWLTANQIAVPAGTSPFRVAIRRIPHPAGVSTAGAHNLIDSGITYGYLRHAYPASRPVGWFKIEDLHKRPHGTGVKDDYFPPELIGRSRPSKWLPHDGRNQTKGERTVEQAAFHTAGLACADDKETR